MWQERFLGSAEALSLCQHRAQGRCLAVPSRRRLGISDFLHLLLVHETSLGLSHNLPAVWLGEYLWEQKYNCGRDPCSSILANQGCWWNVYFVRVECLAKYRNKFFAVWRWTSRILAQGNVSEMEMQWVSLVKLLSSPISKEVLDRSDSFLFACLFVCSVPGYCYLYFCSILSFRHGAGFPKNPKQWYAFARNYLVSGTGTRKSLALISFV